VHRFDQILRDPSGSSAPWDRVLAESSSFVAFPSLGSLVSGWVLIVPRRPMLNLSSLSPAEWDELDEFQSRVAERLRSFGSQLFVFEHGNRMAGSPLGCGVDQAHLHLVPLPFDLMQAAVDHPDGNVKWSMPIEAVSFRAAVSADAEYIGIMDPSSGTAVHGRVRQPTSQWVRRVIAQGLGYAEEWDYKNHPNVPNLLGTVAGYNAA
jgi:ATP adenylyltransferase